MAAQAGGQPAVVLEMLGDRPTAMVDAPEDVLLLELIFARFDPSARADIVRDPDTGDLQSQKLCHNLIGHVPATGLEAISHQ